MARRDPFESLPASKQRALPFPFVLDELAPLDPVTRPMFGALGVYVGERIVMILRDKGPADPDSGVWLAYEPAHEASVVAMLPRLLPIEIFRHKVAGWKKLASRSPEFEEDVGTVCALVLEGDERIGKVPGAKRPRAAGTRSSAAAQKTPPAAAAAGRVVSGAKPGTKPGTKPGKKPAARKSPRLAHGRRNARPRWRKPGVRGAPAPALLPGRASPRPGGPGLAQGGEIWYLWRLFPRSNR